MVEPVDRRSGSGSKPADAVPKAEEQVAPQPAPESDPSEHVHGPECEHEHGHEHDHQSHLPQPDFHLLMQMFFEQALFAMGRIPGLPESEQQVDLNLAKFQIGLLEVIQEKTKGNLSQMEEKYLDEYLHQARLTFVTVQKQKEKQG